MTIVVPECKRRNLETIVRSAEKHRLNTATNPTTTVVKGKEVIVDAEAPELLHMSLETVAARDALW